MTDSDRRDDSPEDFNKKKVKIGKQIVNFDDQGMWDSNEELGDSENESPSKLDDQPDIQQNRADFGEGGEGKSDNSNLELRNNYQYLNPQQ